MATWSLYLDLLDLFMDLTWHDSCLVQCALICRCFKILKLSNMVRSSAACRDLWEDSYSGSIFFTLISFWLVCVARWAAKVSGSICSTLVRSCAALAYLSALLFLSRRAWRLSWSCIFLQEGQYSPNRWGLRGIWAIKLEIHNSLDT